MPIVRVKNCLNCGISHEWVFTGMTLKELRLIKQFTGFRANEFAEASGAGDPDAVAAMLYVLHLKDGIKVPYEDIDLDFHDFEMEPTEEEVAELEKLEKEAQSAAEAAQAPKVTQSGPKTKAASAPK